MCFSLRVMATRLCEWKSAWRIDVDRKKLVTAHETFTTKTISPSLKKAIVLKRENEGGVVQWGDLGTIHWVDFVGCKRDQHRLTVGLNLNAARAKKDDPLGLGKNSKETVVNVRLLFDESCLESPDIGKLGIEGARLCSSFANVKEGMEGNSFVA